VVRCGRGDHGAVGRSVAEALTFLGKDPASKFPIGEVVRFRGAGGGVAPSRELVEQAALLGEEFHDPGGRLLLRTGAGALGGLDPRTS